MTATRWLTSHVPSWMLEELKSPGHVRERFMIIHAWMEKLAANNGHDWQGMLQMLANAVDAVQYMATARLMIHELAEDCEHMPAPDQYRYTLQEALFHVSDRWWYAAMVHRSHLWCDLLCYRNRCRVERNDPAATRSWAAGVLMRDTRAWMCDVIRDIACNPWEPLQPVIGVPLVGLAGKACYDLAAAMYHDGVQSAARPLSDALEEIGCVNPALLGHLRHTRHHYKGCWAVASVLGKLGRCTPVPLAGV